MQYFIIMWILVVGSDRPYSLGTYPTHQECAQAKYAHSQAFHRRGRPQLTCQAVQTSQPVRSSHLPL